MKIYTYHDNITSQLVKVFLAEKRITVKNIACNADVSFLQQLITPQQPVLKLDDHTVVIGAIAICRYFENVAPEKRRLFGQTAQQQAEVEMWLRIIEAQEHASAVHDSINMVRSQAFQQQLIVLFSALEKHLASQPYMLGKNVSVLDIAIYPLLRRAPLCNIDMTYDFPYSQALQTRLSLLSALSEYVV